MLSLTKRSQKKLKRKKEKKHTEDFPGGPVAENLPADTGDEGVLSGWGGLHKPQNHHARAPQPPSPSSRAAELHPLSVHATTSEARTPVTRSAASHRNEKPVHATREEP